MQLVVSQSFIEIRHIPRVQGHHVANDVEVCTAEVAEYLGNLSNWQQPIFPDEQGCSRLEVEPPYFNNSGSVWICDTQMDEGW